MFDYDDMVAALEYIEQAILEERENKRKREEKNK